jgi:hypothetical protein
VLRAKARRDRVDQVIAEVPAAPPYAPVVGRLCCLRRVSTLTALALTVELGDWRRFDPARLGAFLGLVPSEQSSGAHHRQGPITKDRQPPRSAAAGRGRLAPAQAASAQPRARWPPRRTFGPRPLRGGSDQPPASPTLVGSRTAWQTPHQRRGSGRARARRSLLEAGDDDLTAAPRESEEIAPTHNGEERPAPTASYQLGDARP